MNDNLDIVVSICKKIKGLTVNQFYQICDKYNLTNEQCQQAQALINNRIGVNND